MGAGGNLEKIQEKTLPPRKRAGWTGGDDRGPSSKSASKQADRPISEEEMNLTPSAEKTGREHPKDVEGGASAANSRRQDRVDTSDVAPIDAETTGQQKHDSQEADADKANSGRSRDAERGSEGKVESKGEEGVTQAHVGVTGATSETVAVKRVVEEGSDVGSSTEADAKCKRGRTETDGEGIA